MTEIKKCDNCDKEREINSMSKCMLGNFMYYVCDSKCMTEFYEPRATEEELIADAQKKRIAELEKELIENADCIDQLVKSNHISHHPSVELDAMTAGMRAIANKRT